MAITKDRILNAYKPEISGFISGFDGIAYMSRRHNLDTHKLGGEVARLLIFFRGNTWFYL